MNHLNLFHHLNRNHFELIHLIFQQHQLIPKRYKSLRLKIKLKKRQTSVFRGRTIGTPAKLGNGKRPTVSSSFVE